MYDQILYEVKEPVATITLNRPGKLNATTPQMIGEVRHALAQAEDDKHVIGVVIMENIKFPVLAFSNTEFSRPGS